MSFKTLLQHLVATEVQVAVRPLVEAVEQLRAQGDVGARIAAALGQPVRRGPGRPRKFLLSSTKSTERNGKAGGCAVRGCRRKAHTKGYCPSHYKKRRNLLATKRLPADWKEHAGPGSVKDLRLPRGRIGAQAIAAAMK